MTDVFVRRPTYSRFRSLFGQRPDYSVLRCLEYERLAELGLTGKVLDFGGGRCTNYAEKTASWGRKPGSYEYLSANIDPSTEPTYLVEPGAALPVEDECFDAVISLNTLEHVYELDFALEQIHRVLKPGGKLVVVVPFIFRVHGHPNDFMRGTPSFWVRKLSDVGFNVPKIEALVWGPLSTGQSVSGIPGPFKRLRYRTALLFDLIYASRQKQISEIVSFKQDHPNVAAPMGYFIEATKA